MFGVITLCIHAYIYHCCKQTGVEFNDRRVNKRIVLTINYCSVNCLCRSYYHRNKSFTNKWARGTLARRTRRTDAGRRNVIDNNVILYAVVKPLSGVWFRLVGLLSIWKRYRSRGRAMVTITIKLSMSLGYGGEGKAKYWCLSLTHRANKITCTRCLYWTV